MSNEGKYVWIAIPAYGATVTCLTMKSIVYDMFPMVMAGLVAGRLFTVEAYISLISAPLLLLLWRRCYPDLPLWPKIVVATMWLLAAAGEWWLRPLMAAAREGAEGSAASFAALHGVASVMYFGVVGGGVALLRAMDDVEKMVGIFKERRDVIVDGLNKIEGITCLRPKGAFYVFPNIKETGKTSKELADLLLFEAGVAGPARGSPGRHSPGPRPWSR